MKTMTQTIIIASTICALTFLVPQLARAEKYEIVSNQTNATFSSSGAVVMSVGNCPAEKVFDNSSTAALVEGAHQSTHEWGGNAVSTNACLGTWRGDTCSGMQVRDIQVTDANVVLIVEERFLIYTNAIVSQNIYLHGHDSGNTAAHEKWNTISADLQSVRVEQDCNPPDPWTARGTWAPYCRDEMTNRTECIDHYEGVTREVVGYYDADGDGYATLSKVGVVHGAKGDYLDELVDGSYWIVNDVLIAKYTIPRNSFLNFVYGTEDGQNHYWYAIKSLYRITLETTPLRPWWQMPEYQ